MGPLEVATGRVAISAVVHGLKRLAAPGPRESLIRAIEEKLDARFRLTSAERRRLDKVIADGAVWPSLVAASVHVDSAFVDLIKNVVFFDRADEQREPVAQDVAELARSELPGAVDQRIAFMILSEQIRQTADLARGLRDEIGAILSGGHVATGGSVALPPALIPVQECLPEWVGVHPSITTSMEEVAGKARIGQQPPRYIPRDHDEEIRVRLRVLSGTNGGFLLIVGGSSTGKTRSILEVCKQELPSWRIMLPGNADDVRNAIPSVPGQTIIWLDDTPHERFLGDTTFGALSRGDLLRLLMSPRTGPVIIVDMLWPDRYQAMMNSSGSTHEGSPAARDALSIAGEPVRVLDTLSLQEKAAAEAEATYDSRIAIALANPHFGVTQFLAGAHYVTARWHDSDPYQRAIINAAIDLRRAGVNSLLSADTLKRGAIGYLDKRQRAAADEFWFESGLASVCAVGIAAASPLIPQASGAEVSNISGYTVHDYLLQYGLNRRYFKCIPTELWEAICLTISDISDMWRTASSAHGRLLLPYAKYLYCKLCVHGELDALTALMKLLANHLQEEQLLAFAEVEAYRAREQLAYLYFYSEQEDKLRAQAEFGVYQAMRFLVDYLADRGRHEEALADLERISALHPDAKDELQFQLILIHFYSKAGYRDRLKAMADSGDKHARFELDCIERRSDSTGEESTLDGPAPTQASEADLTAMRDKLCDPADPANAALADGLAALGQLSELLKLHTATGAFAYWQSTFRMLKATGRTAQLYEILRAGLNPDGSIRTSLSDYEPIMIPHFDGMEIELKVET